jgi:hypothetical protein
MKLAELVAVPFGVTTVTGPLVAPAGTCVMITPSELTVKSALVPLKRTAVAPVKLWPPIPTDAPTGPLDGLVPEIAGGGTTGGDADVEVEAETEKLSPLEVRPFGVTTVIGPLVAPSGTFVVSWPSALTENGALVPLNITAVVPVKL